eukprot:6533839-Prymnesium_polylepis.1
MMHAGAGGAPRFNSQHDQSATADAMDGWRVLLQRCASHSATRPDRLPRVVCNRPRCLCCRRVD